MTFNFQEYSGYTFTFNLLADTFIRSNLQKRTTEAIKQTKEQQYVNVLYHGPKKYNHGTLL